jgi:predicted small lipoprotein YifL
VPVGIAAMKRTVILVVGAALAITACGQKGPLYLPEKSAAVVTGPAAAPAAPQSAPAPAPPAPAPAPQTIPAQSAPAQPTPATAAPQKKKNGEDSASQPPR